MFKRTLLGLSLATLTISNAQALELKGNIRSSAALTNQAIPLKTNGAAMTGGSGNASLTQKTVYLMKIELSSKEKRSLSHFKLPEAGFSAPAASSLPSKTDAGMNNVPVLNQGSHGSCVTFATTAAIDALLGKGDYISQLCNLELGSYLENKTYLPSGWEGSFGPLVLNQALGFGVISKNYQQSAGCAGKKEYPGTNASDQGSPMSLEDFHAHSEQLSDLYWEPVLASSTRFSDSYEPIKVFLEVKKILATKSADTRITFGALLPVEFGMAGAVGRFHSQNDTWVISNGIHNALQKGTSLGGHEMVIIGYDDNASAVDNEGKTHKGLLTLRNSWGNDVGDKGNYYMSYDFFMAFVMEVQKVGKLED